MVKEDVLQRRANKKKKKRRYFKNQTKMVEKLNVQILGVRYLDHYCARKYLKSTLKSSWSDVASFFPEISFKRDQQDDGPHQDADRGEGRPEEGHAQEKSTTLSGRLHRFQGFDKLACVFPEIHQALQSQYSIPLSLPAVIGGVLVPRTMPNC